MTPEQHDIHRGELMMMCGVLHDIAEECKQPGIVRKLAEAEKRLEKIIENLIKVKEDGF